MNGNQRRFEMIVGECACTFWGTSSADLFTRTSPIITSAILRSHTVLWYFISHNLSPVMEDTSTDVMPNTAPPSWVMKHCRLAKLFKYLFWDDFWWTYDLCISGPWPSSQRTHNVTTTLHLSCGKVVPYKTFTQRCWDAVSFHNVVTT